MFHSGWVLAYHGCDEQVGERILQGEAEVKVSSNNYDWLGKGAYFWENSYHRAMKWAEFLQKHPGQVKSKITKPFVIGAILDPGNCLDLTDAASLEILKESHEDFRKSMEVLNIPLPVNVEGFRGDHDLVKRNLDCAVINFLHQTRSENMLTLFDTVRAPFVEGHSLFEGSKIMASTHIQWAVLHPQKSVRAYFRPRPPAKKN